MKYVVLGLFCWGGVLNVNCLGAENDGDQHYFDDV